jgi:hypothetical protein
VKRRLTLIGVWGLSCSILAIALLLLMVFVGGRGYWLVPVVSIGLPTVGLCLVLLGFLPGTGRPVTIFVRVVPPGGSPLREVKAVRIKSNLYRIITPNFGEPLEFSTGDIVECAERQLPNGQRGLIAVVRT